MPADITPTPTVYGTAAADQNDRRSRSPVYVLVILLLVFAFQYVDRSLIAILAQPIKHEFDLPDSQIGLLTGFIYSVPYALMLFPVGYFVDRRNRRNLLALALALWSLLTFLTGFVRNMAELVIARCFIAGAEAANNPTALSILSDYYGKTRRATAVGIFFAGPAIGSVIAFTLVGHIAQLYGWRAAFFLAGAPGLVLAATLYFTVHEPEREGSGKHESFNTAPPVRQTFAFILSQRSLVHLMCGMTFSATAVSSNIAWMSAFLMRVHHFSLTEAAAAISMSYSLCTAVGQIIGGGIVDRLAARNAAWIGWSCSIFSLAIFVAMLASALSPSSVATVIFIGAWGFPAGLQFGPVGGNIQSLVMPRMRGITSSVYALMLNLIGFGIGPFVVGLMSDALQPRFGDRSLQVALVAIAFCQIAAAIHFFLSARRMRADLGRVATS